MCVHPPPVEDETAVDDVEAEVPLRLAARVLVGDLLREVAVDVDGGAGGEEDRPVRGVMSAADAERVETIFRECNCNAGLAGSVLWVGFASIFGSEV